MVFAHGIGGAKDLPIPAEYAIAGAGAALAVSFIVLALAWRTPRFDAATSGRPVPGWLAATVDHPVFAAALRVLGFAFFVFVVWTAVFGPDLLINPTFGVVYVLLWVGIVPASLLFGPFYKAVSPVRSLNLMFARLTGGDPEHGLMELPRWVGYWPAAFGLFAFVWLELVYPESTYLGPIRLWFAVYIAVLLVGERTVRQLLVRPRRPVRGVLDARRPPLVLRSPLGRHPGVPQPTGKPRWRRRGTGTGRGDLGAVREHRVRQLQGLQRLVALHPVAGHEHHGPQHRGDVRRVRHRRRQLCGRDDGDRGRRRSAGAPCPTGSRTRWFRSSWATCSRTT